MRKRLWRVRDATPSHPGQSGFPPRGGRKLTRADGPPLLFTRSGTLTLIKITPLYPPSRGEF